MTDEELRELEKLARDDRVALTKLTIERLRVERGLVWLWLVARKPWLVPGLVHDAENPSGPPWSVPVTIHNYGTGGEAVFFGPPVPPADKPGWVLACLDFWAVWRGDEKLPEGVDATRPDLLDLESGTTISTPTRAGVTVEPRT